MVFVQQLPELPHAGWLLLLIPLVLASLRIPRWLPAVFLLAGVGWASFIANALLAQTIPPHLEKKSVVIEGEVINLPVKRDRGVRFEFRINNASFQGKPIALPEIVRLSHYPSKKEVNWLPRSGDQWRLTVRLRNPHGFQNPGGFDYEAYLFANRIRATGYVYPKAEKVFLESSIWSGTINRIREAVSARVANSLGAHSQTGLLVALANGDRQGLTTEQWDLLKRTGTIHLVAISGLHLSLVSGLVFLLIKNIWGYFAFAARRMPAQKAAAFIALAAAGFYAALAGFTIPTQRALVMLAVIYLALMLSRQPLRHQPLALALFAVVLFDPLSVLSPGFWLSFLAVTIIYYVTVNRDSISNKWYAGLRIQWWVSLGLVPITLLFFQNASLVSPLANLIAIPIYGILVVPLTLLGIMASLVLPDALSTAVLSLAAFCSSLGWQWLELLSSIGPISFASGAPSLLATASVLIGLAMLAAPPGTPSRWIGVLWCLPLLWVPDKPGYGEVKATLLDVGQGLSLVLQTQKHILVYDTGARFSTRFNAGEAVVVPFLRTIGVTEIDTLIISHGDNDHIGGLDAIQKNFVIKELISGSSKLPSANECRAGDSWSWDGVQFEMLHPDNADGFSGNNSSCVLMMRSQWGNLLATGDIEKKAESRLIDRYSDKLKVAVLVAPHHGSRTSSSLGFLQAVAPDWILVPAGHLNRYRHPSKLVINRYQSLGTPWLVSGRNGAIDVQFKQEPLLPVSYRSTFRKYWQQKVFTQSTGSQM